MTDDQGWGDLSISGNRDLETPHIDSLARDGMLLDRFYVCPVCSPTRAEFLTGRHHGRLGVYSTSAGGERMNLDEHTIADTFKAAGYATGAFGKWHNGMQAPYHPNSRGFEEFYGFCSGHWGNYYDAMLEHNGKTVWGEGFIIDDLTNKAMAWIEAQRGKPFFAYLPYNTPHSPMQVPDRWWNKFKDKELQSQNVNPSKEVDLHKRAALAMCENIDWNVGRLLARLDALKLADNTIVVYFSDNGPNGTRWNGGMKGRKGSTDEGGVRSPCLIRWPGHISAGKVVDNITSVLDVHSTLADLAGVPLATTKSLDGISIKPLLLGQTMPRDRVLVQTWKNKWSVRTQTHRLDTRGDLYDMVNDPGQTHPLGKEADAIAQPLRDLLVSFRETVKVPDVDERPFVIGHPDAIFTQVPARDGVPTGAIKRSNRFPNCSYFHSWTNLADQIVFEAEVAQSGRFEVELLYCCPEEDVGSKIELSFGDASLVTTLSEAKDGPLIGGDEDRYKRAESYVKDWASMTLGEIDLPAGKGQLILKALSKPGASVMEFRLLQLKRL